MKATILLQMSAHMSKTVRSGTTTVTHLLTHMGQFRAEPIFLLFLFDLKGLATRRPECYLKFIHFFIIFFYIFQLDAMQIIVNKLRPVGLQFPFHFQQFKEWSQLLINLL